MLAADRKAKGKGMVVGVIVGDRVTEQDSNNTKSRTHPSDHASILV
jgi:hypothetical protein